MIAELPVGQGAAGRVQADADVQGSEEHPPQWATPPSDGVLPGTVPCQVVARRVDAFRVAYSFDRISNDVLMDVAKARGDANWEAAFALDGVACKLSRKGDAAKVLLQNADMRAAFEINVSDGYVFTIDANAVFLATHTLQETLAMMDRLASGIGPVKDRRLRRGDLAVDIAGWEIRQKDADKFVLPRRASSVKYTDISDVSDDERPADGKLKTYANKRGVTGITVCEGGDIMLRVYDKRTEVARKVSAHKQPIEEAVWRSNGWDGQSCVTRVEFQVRGEALKEFQGGVRKPERFIEEVDAIWQRLVRQWTRMVMLNRTRKKRCALDPRWALLQTVVFEHVAAPASRTRVRGGAEPLDTFSRTMSGLAGRAALPPVRKPGGAATWGDVAALVADFEAAHSVVVVARLKATCPTPDAAIELVLTKRDVLQARFASVDDVEAEALAVAS